MSSYITHVRLCSHRVLVFICNCCLGNDCDLKWSASPACTELEAVVMDWAAEMLGLDATFHNISGTGGGVIQVDMDVIPCSLPFNLTCHFIVK